jgi:hypothetical protein
VKYNRYRAILKYPDPLNADINNIQKHLSKPACINDADPNNTARNSNINYFYSKRKMSILIVILIIIYKMQVRERINYINEYLKKAFAS